ncbi:MAG: hypothetical protein E6H06_03335 [Bacteroidetes bacterium]|nr:MAG: hypothetical protein E6H06_03335 [Bacteroidota bacterium]
MKNRYPGPVAFQYEDRTLFFGREEEIKYIATLIFNYKTTILHAKTGYGKTSLINAGLIPYLIKNSSCVIIRIQFDNYDREKKLTPRQTLLNALEARQGAGESYLGKLVNEHERSAWRYFKKMQAKEVERQKKLEQQILERRQKLEQQIIEMHPSANYDNELESNHTSGPKPNYILLFDQFEELFTYPKEFVQQIGKELQEVLNNRIPDEYAADLKEAFKNKEQLKICADELSVLDDEIPVKIIFSLSTERFNYMTYLAEYIPSLLNNSYKMHRMREDQIVEAIKKPALLDGDFECPPFKYEKKLLNSITDFLSMSKKQQIRRRIEVFEMQIICQQMERICSDYAKRNRLAKSGFELTDKIVSESGFVKDKKNPFSEIITNYYIDSIEAIPEKVDQLSARYIVERKLIDEVTNSRISLDFALLNQVGIIEHTINYLIEKRIIRVEMNTVSGRSYELSHDSLLSPILAAAKQLPDLDRELQSFFKSTIASDNKAEKKRILKAIYNLLPEERMKDEIQNNGEESDVLEKLKSNPVILENTYCTGEDNMNNLTIKETFRQTITQSKLRSQQHAIKGWFKKFAVTVILSLIIIAVLITSISQITKSRSEIVKALNRSTALNYLGYNLDLKRIKDKQRALGLIDLIYDSKTLNENDSAVQSKFLEIVQTPDIQSTFSAFKYDIPSSILNYGDADISHGGNYIVVNNDSINGSSVGAYNVLNENGKVISQFSNVRYAYFTNKDNLLLLAESSVPFNSKGLINSSPDRLILFNLGDMKIDTINLKAGDYLFPRDQVVFYPNEINQSNGEFDSYRVRYTASGNLVIPFLRQKSGRTYQERVMIWKEGKLADWASNMSVSLSKDGKKIMIGQLNNTNGASLIRVLDEDGKELDRIPDIYFADFGYDGSLVFIKNNSLLIRQYGAAEKIYTLGNAVTYAYTKHPFVVAKGIDSIYVINTQSGQIKTYAGYLVDVNFDKNVFFTVNRNIYKTSANSPDTLFRRSFSDTVPARYSCEEKIQSIAYNRKSDETLILTNKNRLLLLDPGMVEKAGLLLTANDLFGFCSDGTALYYLRDNNLRVFKNDHHLINLFAFRAVHDWYDSTTSVTKLKAQEKKHFLDSIFKK